MRTLRISLLALALLGSTQGFAATAQQEKMKTCNAQAGSQSLTGDARKTFLANCLKAGASDSAPSKKLTAQQQKMSTCNKEASDKSLKGDSRKAFLATCLKG